MVILQITYRCINRYQEKEWVLVTVSRAQPTKMLTTFQVTYSGCLIDRTRLSGCNTEYMNMDHKVIEECRYAYASNIPFLDFEQTVSFVST